MSQLPVAMDAAILADGTVMGGPAKRIFVLAHTQSQFDLFQSAVSKYAKKFVKMERVHCAERLHGLHASKAVVIALPDWGEHFKQPERLVSWWVKGLGGVIHEMTEQDFAYIL